MSKLKVLFVFFYKTLLHLILLGAIIIALLLPVLYTNIGTKLGLGVLNYFLKHPIQTTIKGNIGGPIELKNSKIQTPEYAISAQTIHTQLAEDGFALLRDLFESKKKLRVKKLVAKNVKIIYQDDEPFMIPSFENIHKELQKIVPMDLLVDEFSIDDLFIQLSPSKKPIHIKRLDFSQVPAPHGALFKNIVIQAEIGRLAFRQQANSLILSWDLNMPDLQSFIPKVQGDLCSQGTLVLDEKKPVNQHTLNGRLYAHKITYLDKHFTDLKLNLKGTLAHHELQISTQMNDYKWRSLMRGQIKTTPNNPVTYNPLTHWLVTLDRLDFHTNEVLPPSKGQLDFVWDPALHLIKANARGQLLGKHDVKLYVETSTHNNPDHHLSGSLQANINDLSQLKFLKTEFNTIKGGASLHLQFKGPLLNPLVSGGVEGKNLIIDTAMTRDITSTVQLSALKLDGQAKGPLRLAGQGKMGKGHFTLAGTSDFTNHTPNIDLNMKGTQLTLSQQNNYLMIGNPDLHFALKDNMPKVSGSVFITEAKIHTQNFSRPMNALSADVKVLTPHTPEKKKNNYQPVQMNLQVTLGDNVVYKGFGLKSRLLGQVRLFTKNDNIHAHGKITLVNGKYVTHGSVLRLQQGRIAFLGDQFMNPSLDIRATKKISTAIQADLFNKNKKRETTLFESIKPRSTQTIMVGIAVSGTAQAPTLKMISSPAMDDADVLSYMILNKPQRDASEAQSTLALEAVNELMGLITTNKKSQFKLAKNLKLDTLGLKEVPADPHMPLHSKQTALVVGKQLSDKLYAEYSLRVLDNASTVSLRYFVSKHLVLEGSATKNSASSDLLFTFESD